MSPTPTTTTTWQVDPTHSSIGFTVRHMVVAKVHGRFSRFSGQVQLPPNGLENGLEGATADVKIDAASIDTQVQARDEHLRSADFFDVQKFPELSFKSSKLENVGKDRYRITGALTLHGVTQEVILDAEYLGRMTDPFGAERIAFSAVTALDRKQFGLSWNKALEAGGVLVGDRIDIQLEIQATKAAASIAD